MQNGEQNGNLYRIEIRAVGNIDAGLSKKTKRRVEAYLRRRGYQPLLSISQESKELTVRNVPKDVLLELPGKIDYVVGIVPMKDERLSYEELLGKLRERDFDVKRLKKENDDLTKGKDSLFKQLDKQHSYATRIEGELRLAKADLSRVQSSPKKELQAAVPRRVDTSTDIIVTLVAEYGKVIGDLEVKYERWLNGHSVEEALHQANMTETEYLTMNKSTTSLFSKRYIQARKDALRGKRKYEYLRETIQNNRDFNKTFPYALIDNSDKILIFTPRGRTKGIITGSIRDHVWETLQDVYGAPASRSEKGDRFNKVCLEQQAKIKDVIDVLAQTEKNYLFGKLGFSITYAHAKQASA